MQFAPECRKYSFFSDPIPSVHPAYCLDHWRVTQHGILFDTCRLRLGLWETAQDVDDGKLDVRPRWPLTDRRDSRSMPSVRSMRKSRIFTSLTELTAEALSSKDCIAAAAT